MASGERSARASKRRWTHVSGNGERVSFHSRRSWPVSSGPRSGSPATGRSGSASPASSRTWRERVQRSTLVPSKRSVSCSIQPSIRSPASRSDRVSSSLAVPLPISSIRKGRLPGGCRASMAWKSGVRLGSRAGCSSSTSRPNGTSWCRKAPIAVRRTLSTDSRSPRASPKRARSTSVLTNSPISSSSSIRSRLAAGVPTRMSSWPLSRWRRVWKAVRRTMKGVAPAARASRRRPWTVPGGRSTGRLAPRCRCRGGRGRSSGSSSGGRSPASSSRHQPSCASGRARSQTA